MESEITGHSGHPPKRLPIERFSIAQLDREYVALDTERLTYHNLNQIAFDIWLACDGSRSVTDIRDLLSADHPGLGADTVEHGVEELSDAGLLVDSDPAPIASAGAPRYSRRRVLAAATLPIVVSITAPHAASAETVGQACSWSGMCSTNCCLSYWNFPCNGNPQCVAEANAIGPICVPQGVTRCLPSFPSVCITPYYGQFGCF